MMAYLISREFITFFMFEAIVAYILSLAILFAWRNLNLVIFGDNGVISEKACISHLLRMTAAIKHGLFFTLFFEMWDVIQIVILLQQHE